MHKTGFSLFTCFFCLFSAFGLQSLSAQTTISGVTATMRPDNALRYEIDFSVSPDASAYVEYGYWNGTDSVWISTSVSPTAASHSLTLVGLKAAEVYNYRIVALNETDCVVDGGHTFTVATLPSGVGFAEVDSTWADPNAVLPGYFMSTTRNPNPKKLGQVFDREGTLLWYQEMPGDPAPTADGLCQYMSLSDSQSVYFLECGRIVEMGLDGTIRADVDVHALRPNFYPHHSVFRNRDGNLTALVSVVDTIDKTSVGGSANAIVVAPGIIVVDDQGNEVWAWNGFDHYDPLQSPGPGGYWVPKFGPEAIDWKHANSLMQDLDGNYMATFRDENQVVKISGITGNVLWTCGDNGNIEIMAPDSFMATNSIGLANGANYLMMDLTSKDTVSRAIDWWIDWGYATPTFMIDREYVMPSQYFSGEGGSAARLEGGRTWVASSKGGIFEFDLSANLLWFARQDTSLEHAWFLGDFYARETASYSGQTLFCLTDTAFALQGSPAGGNWFGPGVTGGVFNATQAGAGNDTIYYKYGTDTLAVPIMVDADPNCSVAVEPGRAWNLHFAAFPNPFSSQINLCFTLVAKTELEISLYSLDGRRIALLYEGVETPGDHNIHLDLAGLSLPEGPVLLRMRSSDGGASTRIMLHFR